MTALAAVALLGLPALAQPPGKALVVRSRVDAPERVAAWLEVERAGQRSRLADGAPVCVGERAWIVMRSVTTSALWALDHSPDGSCAVIYPNAVHDRSPRKQGDEVRLGPFLVSPPAGVERIYVHASDGRHDDLGDLPGVAGPQCRRPPESIRDQLARRSAVYQAWVAESDHETLEATGLHGHTVELVFPIAPSAACPAGAGGPSGQLSGEGG